MADICDYVWGVISVDIKICVIFSYINTKQLHSVWSLFVGADVHHTFLNFPKYHKQLFVYF